MKRVCFVLRFLTIAVGTDEREWQGFIANQSQLQIAAAMLYKFNRVMYTKLKLYRVNQKLDIYYVNGYLF